MFGEKCNSILVCVEKLIFHPNSGVEFGDSAICMCATIQPKNIDSYNFACGLSGHSQHQMNNVKDGIIYERPF